MSWFEVQKIHPDTFLISEAFHLLDPRYQLDTVNSYLLLGSDRAVLVDSGTGVGNLLELIKELTSLPVLVCSTHYHWDHTGGNYQFSERAIHILESDIILQPQDTALDHSLVAPEVNGKLGLPKLEQETFQYRPSSPTCVLRDGDQIDLGGRVLQVIHTPGHSPGHVCFWESQSGMLFSGDTLYQGPIFLNYEGGNPQAYRISLQKLIKLPEIRMICPGHQAVIRESVWLDAFFQAADRVFTEDIPGKFRKGFITGREIQEEGIHLWLPGVNTQRDDLDRQHKGYEQLKD